MLGCKMILEEQRTVWSTLHIKFWATDLGGDAPLRDPENRVSTALWKPGGFEMSVRLHPAGGALGPSALRELRWGHAACLHPKADRSRGVFSTTWVCLTLAFCHAAFSHPADGRGRARRKLAKAQNSNCQYDTEALRNHDVRTSSGPARHSHPVAWEALQHNFNPAARYGKSGTCHFWDLRNGLFGGAS